MKVGIYLSDMYHDSGGGFTFQEDIFLNWIRLRTESQHRFVILSDRPHSVSALINDPLVPIIQSLVTPKGFQRELRSRIPLLRRGLPASNKVAVAAAQAQIDFLWPLNQARFSLPDVPYMYTVLDLQHRLQPWFPEVSQNGEWERRERNFTTMLARAARVIVGTEVGKSEVGSFYGFPTTNIRTLPLPTPDFALDASAGNHADLLAKFNLQPGYLLYPAQFWAHKNHANLLIMLQILRDKHGLVLPMVFVGSDKGNQTYIRHMVEQLNLSAQVHFLGFVSRGELIALYRNAFALSYMTFFGPDNLPPLEAFALGCPVIASNVSGAQEQLGDAAILVDPKDPSAQANSIKMLYDSPRLQQQLIERGFARAKRWTGKDYVRGVFEILDEFQSIRYSWSS